MQNLQILAVENLETNEENQEPELSPLERALLREIDEGDEYPIYEVGKWYRGEKKCS
ncbi:MAG: hypothetical protein LBI53_07660 [Candidatus Peribacteria bacterium]|jgi:hypothetical protein|nr:hypothetical protein [Candidatus Peribacteria bacterium]